MYTSWPPCCSRAVVSAVNAAMWLGEANGTATSLAASAKVAAAASSARSKSGCWEKVEDEPVMLAEKEKEPA